jgi:hypothetical protein
MHRFRDNTDSCCGMLNVEEGHCVIWLQVVQSSAGQTQTIYCASVPINKAAPQITFRCYKLDLRSITAHSGCSCVYTRYLADRATLNPDSLTQLSDKRFIVGFATKYVSCRKAKCFLVAYCSPSF